MKGKKKIKGRKLDSFIYAHNKEFAKKAGFITNMSESKDVNLEVKELDVTIFSKGTKGDGIAKYKSYTVFVPNTNVNDKVKVTVKKVIKKIIFAEKKRQ